MENKRVNVVGFKGECRKCVNCGDVKIWDYPNERRCPYPLNPKRPRHRWRPINKLTKEEQESIDRQIEYETKMEDIN